MRIVQGIEELKALAGQELGLSDWFTIDQERIQAFADATGDHQWIHVDVERAQRESARINYGLDKVRFPAPVPAGARVRARVLLADVEPQGEGRWMMRIRTTIELEGSERPACVAESLALLVF